MTPFPFIPWGAAWEVDGEEREEGEEGEEEEEDASDRRLLSLCKFCCYESCYWSLESV